MPMNNNAWLCNYNSYEVSDVYGMVIQTAEFDGARLFFLEKKKSKDILSTIELEEYEFIDKLDAQFWRDWSSYSHIDTQRMPFKLFKEKDFNTPSINEFLFRITNGYLVMNKQLYDVISQFNLGKTHFSQVYIHDIQTGEQLSDVPYYFIKALD